MNLPNKLTLIRIACVPFIMIFIVYDNMFGENVIWTRAIAAAIFLFTTLTDLFDGKIARKYGMVTNFGKFMDPVADKLMVICTLIAMTVSYEELTHVYIWVTAIVIFRELAVTSIRLVASSSDGSVIAASWLGKLKTTIQCVTVMIAILEKIVLPWAVFSEYHLLTWISTALMVFITLYSGWDYFKSYRKYLDFSK